MSEGFAYLDIIFVAMIAAFIAFRLRSVLGRRTGHERRRPTSIGPAPVQRTSEPAVGVPERSATTAPTVEGPIADVRDPALKTGLTQIRLADPRFDLDVFLQGARAAFAMIVEAFAKGDKAALRPLLSDEVFRSFAGAIDQRAAAGHTLTTELVALENAEVSAAAVTGTRARIGVRFTSQQINATRDAAGNVVEGDPSRIDTVVDLWTFERDTRSRDPNWQLVETRTPE